MAIALQHKTTIREENKYFVKIYTCWRMSHFDHLLSQSIFYLCSVSTNLFLSSTMFASYLLWPAIPLKLSHKCHEQILYVSTNIISKTSYCKLEWRIDIPMLNNNRVWKLFSLFKLLTHFQSTGLIAFYNEHMSSSWNLK